MARGSAILFALCALACKEGEGRRVVRAGAGGIEASDPGYLLLYESVYSTQVAMDPSGNAMLVWARDGRIRATHYDPDAGWKPPLNIDGGVGTAADPQLGMDDTGHAIALWVEDANVSTIYDPVVIWANRFVPGIGWGTAQAVTAPYVPYFEERPGLAVGRDGAALVVWQSASPEEPSLRATRFHPDTGWGAAEVIVSGALFRDRIDVSLNASGEAAAVWQESDGDLADTGIVAARYSPATGWGTPERVNPQSTGGFAPRIGMDAGGAAILIWSSHYWADEYIPYGYRRDLMADRLPAGGAWAGNITLDVGPDRSRGGADFPHGWMGPKLGIDDAGNGVAVWIHDFWNEGGSYWDVDLVASRFEPGTGWGAALDLWPADEMLWEPRVTMDRDGEAVVVWIQNLGTGSLFDRREIWASSFVPGTGWTGPEPIIDDVPVSEEWIGVACGGGLAVVVFTGWELLGARVFDPGRP